MCADSVSRPGPRAESLPNRRGLARARGARARGMIVLASAAVGLALAVAPVPATAQVPGPESFAQEPRTPLDLWGAIHYLVTTDQSRKAVPYLDRFVKSQPDDATMVEIRNRYGIGSVLRLADDATTARYAKPLADRLDAASRRFAAQPERLARAVAAVTASPHEQNYGVARLKEAGPHAIPALVDALRSPETTPERRALLVRNMGRLEPSAVPGLIAVLESGDPGLQEAAAEALGHIRDSRALPALAYLATARESAPGARTAARTAIRHLTGRPFEADPRETAQLLARSAWEYHRHKVDFPGDKAAVWNWDADRKNVAPRTLSRREAEVSFATRLADQALRLDPTNRDARAAALSIALRRATDQNAPETLATRDKASFDRAIAAGPETLSDVLRRAIGDADDNVATAAATAIGTLTKANDLAAHARPHPLVEALWAPGPRAPLAAAKAIVALDPTRPFPGSSRLVPVLSRYIMTQHPPRAVVIDDNPSRGSQLAGALRSLGYEAALGTTGSDGFRAAAETADVEAVFVTYAFAPSSWSVTDVLTNLKSDARTRDLPVFIYGPADLELKRPSLPRAFPGVRYVVQPLDGATLERLIGGRPSRLSDSQRGALADEAAGLLARVAARPDGPFAEDLSEAEPALAVALGKPGTSLGATTALGDVPDADAQRSLADVALDVARPIELRRTAAERLTPSIRKFGPLVSADQELSLVAAARSEADAALRNALAKAVGALRAGVAAAHRNAPAPARAADTPATPESRP